MTSKAVVVCLTQLMTSQLAGPPRPPQGYTPWALQCRVALARVDSFHWGTPQGNSQCTNLPTSGWMARLVNAYRSTDFGASERHMRVTLLIVPVKLVQPQDGFVLVTRRDYTIRQRQRLLLASLFLCTSDIAEQQSQLEHLSGLEPLTLCSAVGALDN